MLIKRPWKKPNAFFFITLAIALFYNSMPILSASAQTVTPQLGNFIDIRVDNINQNIGAMAYNSKHQEFLVVWDEPGTSGHREIYGQRVGVDGSLHGNALRLAFSSNYDCVSPVVSYSDLQDKYMVAFTQIISTTDYDIVSVLLSWDGSSLTNMSIDLESFRKTQFPAIIYNSQNDEFLVVYENDKPDPGGSEILAQRRKAGDGSQIGTTTTIAGVPGQRRRFPRVAYNKTRNEYMFAYTFAADTLPATPTRAMFKRFKADLSTALTNETYLTTDDAYDVALSAGSDEYLLVWSGNNVSGGPLTKILGRRVLGNGTLGPLITLADHSPDGCRYPSVVYDSIYSYLITWDYINVSRGNVTDIKGRILPAGQDTPSGDEFAVSYVYYTGGGLFIPDGNQTISKAACTALGACLVAYQDSGPNVFVNPVGDYEIRGRLVTPISTPPGGFAKIGLSNGLKGQPTDLLLFWGPSSLVGSYEYCLDTIGNNLCNSGNWIAAGTENSINLSGLSGGTTYYWQVRARNGAGSTEADGGTWWNFSTFQFLTPEGFTKTGPAKGVTGQPANPTLTWGGSGQADSYEYCLDTTGNQICDSGNWKSTGASTSANLSGLVEGTDYYWQVRARNTAGTIEADGGTWWKFSTQKSGSTLYLPLVFNQWSSGPGVSSETLIDQAVAAGILDAETALIYKVYAAFGDNRLPGQYLGDDAEVTDSLVMVEVRRRWTTLSSPTQAILQPFLIPPTEAGSYEQQGLSMTSDGGPLKATTQWKVVDAASGVRIYYHPRFPEDQAKAEGLASEIDAYIFPKLMAVMENRKWLSFGGDDRLKVYLVSKLRANGEAVPYSDNKASAAYILLRRDLPLGDETHKGLMAVTAHEMKHAVQFSFNTKEDSDNYDWLSEATAKWFEEYAYPKINAEFGWARRFLKTPSLSLEDRTEKRHYGAYLLPFYLTHRYGSAGFVSSIWKNTEALGSLSAVDLAIPGGFEAVWPEFVRYNWNSPPYDDYYKWDGLPLGADALVDLVPLGSLQLPVEVKHLSAEYYHFVFNDENIRSVLFYNGLNGKLVEGEAPIQGPNNRKYYHEALTPEETKGIGIQALIKVAGQDWRWEDWSHENVKGFCRDAKAERLEELVLIFSNSEFDPNSPNYVLKPRGLNPTILTSDMGCWQWKGTTSRTKKYQSKEHHNVESLNTTVTFERTDLMTEDPVYSVKEGTLWWSYSGEGYQPISCLMGSCWGGYWIYYTGSTAETLGPTDGTLQTFNSHTGGSRFRGVYGNGESTAVLPIDCSEPPCFFSGLYYCDWFHTNDPTNPPPKITSGTLAEGKYEHTDAKGFSIVNSWHLEAQREP